ncbi:MAG: glycosyltransferase [Ignavibacteria bacterium]|nr:MAG: glycosyltransferase [Ignavibacteria bacterium]
MILIIIIIISGLFYASFLLSVYNGLKKLKERSNNEIIKSVSLIIPFRDERENLPGLIDSLNGLEYPEENLSIIFIDDGSQDESVEIVKGAKLKFKSKLLHSENGGKKGAIQKAVNETDSEIIMITDADCVHHPKWVMSIVKYFDESTGFIAGPVIFSGKGFFNELQKLEFAGIVIASAGLIGNGTPFTCSAANIAFRKEAFLEVSGYWGNEQIPSGDDEFLMQKIAYESKWDVNYAIGEEVIVSTKPNESLKQFFNQRSRWASKGLDYKIGRIKYSLIMVALFFISIIAAFILSLNNIAYLFVAILAIIWKIIWELKVMLLGKKKIIHSLSLKYFLVAEIFHIPYIVFSALAGTFVGYTWKGRRVSK